MKGRDRRQPVPPQKPMAGRVPVHDMDAEAAVISAMMLASETISRVRAILRWEQCYSDANGRIVEAIYAVADSGAPVDIVSVGAWLRDRERLGQVGGAVYLAQLSDATPAIAHVEAHAAIIVRLWVQRQGGALGHRLAAESYGDVGDVHQWIADCRAALNELGEAGRTSTEEPLQPVLARVMREVVELAEKGKRSDAVQTGFRDFDKATAGLFPGRVTYIAARPGIGKSSLVRNIALNVAGLDAEHSDVEHGVVIIQLEGTRQEVARGMLCSEAHVNLLNFAAGIVQPAEWRRLTDTGAWEATLPIWIEDRSCTVDDIIAIVRRQKDAWERKATPEQRERRISLVIVDYVQRVKADVARDKRNEEIGVVSGRLKEDLAKGCNVHVLAIAAMNRDVEKRKGGRPQLSDLRDCGDLESDADAVLFLDRPRADADQDDRKPVEGDGRTVATAFFGKNRFGVEGATFKLRFFPMCARFADLYEGEEP